MKDDERSDDWRESAALKRRLGRTPEKRELEKLLLQLIESGPFKGLIDADTLDTLSESELLQVQKNLNDGRFVFETFVLWELLSEFIPYGEDEIRNFLSRMPLASTESVIASTGKIRFRSRELKSLLREYKRHERRYSMAFYLPRKKGPRRKSQPHTEQSMGPAIDEARSRLRLGVTRMRGQKFHVELKKNELKPVGYNQTMIDEGLTYSDLVEVNNFTDSAVQDVVDDYGRQKSKSDQQVKQKGGKVRFLQIDDADPDSLLTTIAEHFAPDPDGVTFIFHQTADPHLLCFFGEKATQEFLRDAAKVVAAWQQQKLRRSRKGAWPDAPMVSTALKLLRQGASDKEIAFALRSIKKQSKSDPLRAGENYIVKLRKAIEQRKKKILSGP